MSNNLRIYTLKNDSNDDRGDSYNASSVYFDYLGPCRALHFATINPGKIRGNHYHIGRKELITVLYFDTWQLAWKHKEQQDTLFKIFTGKGAVLIEVDPEISHAIKNTGFKSLIINAYSNKEYSNRNDETFPMIVIQ